MKTSILLALAVASPAFVCAQDAQTIDALKKELQELRDRTLQLEEKLKRIETAPPAAITPSTNAPPLAPDVANASRPSSWSPTAPIPVFRAGASYMNVSADALFAAGGSTAPDIANLQRGAHDPIQRG